MKHIMSLVMSLIFAVALLAVVGFVIASIKGYDYSFGSALPYGVVFGLIIFAFGSLITAEER